VQEKVAQQLHKNKLLLAEVVADTSEKGVVGYSEVVLDVVKFASFVGLMCGGDKKSLLDLFSKVEAEQEPIKVKEKRELKNMECSINFEARGRRPSLEKCQRWWVWDRK
jgi:hypothetical protein